MKSDDLLPLIDDLTRPTCAHCTGTLLADGPSPDFCDAACQRAWTVHTADVQRLTGYREAADTWGDAMVVRDGEVGGGDEAREIAEWMDRQVEIRRRLAEHRRRRKLRFRVTLLVAIASSALVQAASWLLPEPWPWIALGVQIVATVGAWAWQIIGNRRDTRELLDP